MPFLVFFIQSRLTTVLCFSHISAWLCQSPNPVSFSSDEESDEDEAVTGDETEITAILMICGYWQCGCVVEWDNGKHEASTLQAIIEDAPILVLEHMKKHGLIGKVPLSANEKEKLEEAKEEVEKEPNILKNLPKRKPNNRDPKKSKIMQIHRIYEEGHIYACDDDEGEDRPDRPLLCFHKRSDGFYYSLPFEEVNEEAPKMVAQHFKNLELQREVQPPDKKFLESVKEKNYLNQRLRQVIDRFDLQEGMDELQRQQLEREQNSQATDSPAEAASTCDVNHQDLANYKQEDNPGYCRGGLYLSNINCYECGVLFIPKGKAVKARTYKPSTSTPVFCCPSLERGGICKRAVCKPCFDRKFLVAV